MNRDDDLDAAMMMLSLARNTGKTSAATGWFQKALLASECTELKSLRSELNTVYQLICAINSEENRKLILEAQYKTRQLLQERVKKLRTQIMLLGGDPDVVQRFNIGIDWGTQPISGWGP